MEDKDKDILSQEMCISIISPIPNRLADFSIGAIQKSGFNFSTIYLWSKISWKLF